MKNVKKKIGSVLLAFAIMFTTVLGITTPVQAASSTSTTENVFLDGGSVTAGEVRAIPFTLTANSGFRVYIIVPSPVDVQVQLLDSNQEAYGKAASAAADLFEPIEYEGQTYYAITDTYPSIPAGDYYYMFQFAQTTQVIIDVEQINKISIPSKATITAGFTKKLSVTGAKVKKWESRDKSIAVVDKNGKVTAKKKGKTKIIATLEDGKTKLECTVTVAKNSYSDKKMTIDDCKSGMWDIAAYSAYFDAKGNLIVKTQCVNNTANQRLTELRNVKIVVKDVNDKTVGVYKKSKMSISVSPQSAKGYTFTIKKADLKKKKADLRNGTVVVDAKGYGR